MRINIFWFRRDLRLEDNTALNKALAEGIPVLSVFIFDTSVIDELAQDDPRISFIYDTLSGLNVQLRKYDSSLLILKGDPVELWKNLTDSYSINAVFVNKDYEPYSISRDLNVESFLNQKSIPLHRFKDQVIFEEKEILKSDNNPYTLFTPYKNRWLRKLSGMKEMLSGSSVARRTDFIKKIFPFPSLEALGFKKSLKHVLPFDLTVIPAYDKYRDFPSMDRTTYLGPHLRFGTVSIRGIVRKASEENAVFLSELIWREFFMQILFNYPHVVTGNFRSKYDHVPWRNSESDFEKWSEGQTGYAIVDAGMRQLNETGYMHNRVRMITAGFLCKHLLIDWRWGEAYFASRLLDYELSSNNGNWQWAAGTGCDAAQYFRVFNPETQQQRFDRERAYIKKWIKEIDTKDYPAPMIDHNFARKRVIEAYKSGFILYL
jgi:deoxyribodipyrimidine photo-lyase